MSVHTSTTKAQPDGGRVDRRGSTRETARPWVPAVAGAVFFALIMVHAQLRSGVPSATDPAQDVVTYVSRHHERLQLSAVALAVAMAAAIVWLAAMLDVLRRFVGRTHAGQRTAFAGGIVAASAGIGTALIEGLLALRFADLGAGATRALWTLFLTSTGAIALGLSLLIAGTLLAARRTPLFARWLFLASIGLVLLSLAGAVTIGYDSTAAQTVAGTAVLLDSVWILLFSLLVSRHPPPVASP
jgi:hypothetical protein